MNKLKLKVCGMTEQHNIKEVASLLPDMIGFIFVKESKRYFGENTIPFIPASIKKIGVFQNQSIEFVRCMIKKYKLDGVQLHGNESAEYCQSFEELTVLKAFTPANNFDWEILNQYLEHTNYFLFDAKIKGQSGGTGKKFDWSLLDEYHLSHPFFLSGGIGLNDAIDLKKIKNPFFKGVDINSKFENDNLQKKTNHFFFRSTWSASASTTSSSPRSAASSSLARSTWPT